MDYIQEMRDIVYDLETRIQKTKLNVDGIGQLMQVSNTIRHYKKLYSLIYSQFCTFISKQLLKRLIYSGCYKRPI